jgi:cell division protein FtsB
MSDNMRRSSAEAKGGSTALRGDDRSRGDVGLRRKAATLASILAFIALVVGSLFGDGGVLQVLAQRERSAALQRQNLALRVQNGRLAAEIAALRRDPRAVERIAREELGLARPGETVFVIRQEPTAPDE